jgi:hypothetical protein
VAAAVTDLAAAVLANGDADGGEQVTGGLCGGVGEISGFGTGDAAPADGLAIGSDTTCYLELESHSALAIGGRG